MYPVIFKLFQLLKLAKIGQNRMLTPEERLSGALLFKKDKKEEPFQDKTQKDKANKLSSEL